MAFTVCMRFKNRLLHLMYVVYLVLVVCVLAQEQGDPCAGTGIGHGLCGLYGICRPTELSYKCTCLPGFQFLDNDNHAKGCIRNTSQLLCSQLHNGDGGGAEMQRIDQTDWNGCEYEHLTFMNATACQQACIADCFCTVVIYANINGTENCWKRRLPIGFGRVSLTRTTFLKVYTGVCIDVPPYQRKVEKGRAFEFIGISLMGCSFLSIAFMVFVWFYTCRPKLRALQEYSKFGSVGLKVFRFQEIEAATTGFKQEIGRGAFGKVYKGVLSDGRAIAVKKLDNEVIQEQQNGEKEFRTEMCIIGGSHHKNLVKLYGFCHEGSHRLLVYEYMSNGSLDRVLFKGTRDLDWHLRFQIALETARGIVYLHEECTNPILHCDIKPQNILLDENYHAKIADFGISKLIGAEQTRTFTVARGTIGYMAPEWKKTIAVTVKVDVYSFGVMLLEIICCRKMFELNVPENEMILADWVYHCFKCGRLQKLIENQGCRGMEVTQLERMVLVGLWCIQEDYSLRPSMKRVVQMLEGTVDIMVPPDPGSSHS
ncbi:hypothetical protein SUGI_0717450 [Cryptomeria japonica]|uniref:G-type lectin S-receptor-like serine/threonine-protein kinase LECRK3 n=1 Tax=Cryptomeria japonica TaxID=3369 RepID=UPI002414A065|nr:G-type lectin S-receptor-like serine/threonine-protein kinase LECRK3 [Cryptomeria japonica]GLJ35716.1 hypothetical protein SUGI_0717450 [Cryptomeria japonica]